jgi:hypothetical protein
MKPETEKLLHQCRVMLLHYSNEQLNTLFMSWFERMVGEESIDEVLDDLCLLLGYGVRSAHSHILYATYTAWWEVEGSADLDGEFECVDVAALQHHLITMPIKQFAFVTELAYHVCVLDAEVEGQPCPPTGQEWLRALAIWLGNGAREPFHSQIWRKEVQTTPPVPQHQLTRKQRKAQQRKLEHELVEQAWQCGYLLLGPDVSNQVLVLVQSRCKKNRRPYISVQQMGAQFASIRIDLCTIRRALEAGGKLFSGALTPTFMPSDEIRQRLTSFSAHYSVRAETAQQEACVLSPRGDVFELKQVLQADVPGAVQDFMALWPEILTQYEAQLEASRVAYLVRQRELEEARKPAWIKAIARLSAQGQAASCPDLAETVVLPEDWAPLLSKEQLGAFLTFLKLPASSREIKANLVQHLLTRLEMDKTAKAQFFEVFAFELAVPPWELETLLGCTTTERKRWTEGKKLPVIGYGSFRKAGSDHTYAVYDRRVILTLASSDIEAWRSEHQALVRERRKAAAQAAAANRKAKRQEEQMMGAVQDSNRH